MTGPDTTWTSRLADALEAPVSEQDGWVSTGGLSWRPTADLTSADLRKVAGAIAEAERTLSSAGRRLGKLALLPRRLDQALAGGGLGHVLQDVPRNWIGDLDRPARGWAEEPWRGYGDYDGASRGRRAVLVDAHVVFAAERQTWVSSHHTGYRGVSVARLHRGDLPATSAAMKVLVDAVWAVHVASSPPPDTRAYACAYCHQTFEPLHFDAEAGACHGCCEHHLGVVY